MSLTAKSRIKNLSVYEPGKPVEELARELGCGGIGDIDKLASNENPLGPSPLAVEAMKLAAARMHLYPDAGCYYLHREIAKRLSVKPNQVQAGNGSNELLEFVGHVFLEAGSDVIVADHAFLVYRLVADMFQARVVTVPMRDFVHDLDAMLGAVTPETRVIFIANPNNPTGTMVDNDALVRFMDAVPERVTVCIDEAYIELVDEERRPDVLRYVRESRNVIVLRSFSKSYGLAGLRIGYAVAPEELIGLMRRVRQPFSVNSPAQAAAIAALDDETHLLNTRKTIAAGRAFFEETLALLGLPFVPSKANFMLVDVGDGLKVCEEMERRRVIVRSMNPYGLPHHIRISIGLPGENERCIKALEEAVKIRR